MTAEASGELSVIVITYNSGAVLRPCLDSVMEHLPGADIVVVDNDSRDATLPVADTFPGVRVINTHANLGFGAAVNVGVRAARSAHALVLNPDVTLLNASASELACLADVRALGLLGCRMGPIAGTPRYLISPCWNWKVELYWVLAQFFLVPRELSLRRPRFAAPATPRWVPGAAFIVRRDEFLEIGGFDESFFLYFEDRDLSHAYRQHLLPIATTDAVVVEHAGGQSSPRDSTMMAVYNLLGVLQYVSKWEGPQVAADAARKCVVALGHLETAGRAVARAPVVGSRASRKAGDAAAVHAALVAAAKSQGAETHYTAARIALATALRAAPGEPAQPSSCPHSPTAPT